MWQDYLLMIVQWAFVAALVPAILHPTNKPPFSTALISAMGLFVISFAVGTLELWLASASAAANGIAWCVLAYQRYRLNKIGSN